MPPVTLITRRTNIYYIMSLTSQIIVDIGGTGVGGSYVNTLSRYIGWIFSAFDSIPRLHTALRCVFETKSMSVTAIKNQN